ncbi:hypothetical protein GJ496_004104, partial [Pomphorhynchus laevis]
MDTKVRFIPFASNIDLGFWQSIHERKLEKLKLCQDAEQIVCGYDFAQEHCPPLMNFRLESFDCSLTRNTHLLSYQKYGMFLCHCNLTIFNTLDDFNGFNKAKLMNCVASKFRMLVDDDQWIQCIRELCECHFNVFIDLKSYKFTYSILHPSIHLVCVPTLTKPIEYLSTLANKPLLDCIISFFEKNKEYPSCCFGIDLQNYTICSLSNALRGLNDGDRYILAVADPSCILQRPGWPIRNLLIFVGLKIKALTEVSILCLSGLPYNAAMIKKSYILHVSLDFAKQLDVNDLCALGWELNENREEKPMHVDLTAHLDPIQLVDTANSLNLQLMKWRMAPNLKLERIQKLKYLLIGAGTLGCNVARCLMFTFSITKAQSLYTFTDCSTVQRKRKVDVAVDRCAKINPSLDVSGVFISIPSPGQPLTKSEKLSRHKVIEDLERLILDNDVICLLTDSRSSRWLPTVIGSSKDKLVLTGAVGFDSFLVMRHGNTSELGCYFCSDVTTPSELQIDRSIDQKCTVTRPGISMMASSALVELIVNVCTHPEGKKVSADAADGPLGSVPHSIRGFINNFNICCPTVASFKSCTACSQSIKDKYNSDGIEFLEQCLDYPEHIEVITGLTELKT